MKKSHYWYFLGAAFFGIILIACSDRKQESKTQNRPVFGWLIGNWERTNEQAGRRTFEEWHKINDSLFHGMGYTLQGTDTVFKELLQLVKDKNNWEYVVRMPSEKKETRFAFTQQTDTSFTCRNNKNEFPKQIRYFKTGNDIKADISDDSTTIAFQFKRIGN
ncbi:DUF6265 family protein [Flavobacterium sp.]|uniref:DUF6265 family protein n=1 Tax=Flavobacterium sp. TaxID=239 RepID=UPI003B9AD558